MSSFVRSSSSQSSRTEVANGRGFSAVGHMVNTDKTVLRHDVFGECAVLAMICMYVCTGKVAVL